MRRWVLGANSPAAFWEQTENMFLNYSMCVGGTPKPAPRSLLIQFSPLGS